MARWSLFWLINWHNGLDISLTKCHTDIVNEGEPMTDLATSIVSDHHETIAWCENITKGLEYGTYRPNEGLVAMRNAFLHSVMHHRSHQQEY